MEFQFLLPFFAIPSLRSMHTLTAHTFDDEYGNFESLDLGPLKGTSNVTFLAWDEADITWMDAVKAIAIPRALQGFRWSQEFRCFSVGSCYGPFQHLIGRALGAHKDTLRSLDLDIRHRYCNGQGHPGNPYGTLEGLRRVYPNAKDRRMPQDGILIGSLKEFSQLRTLSIDATSLCGHQKWSPAPIQMIDALPPNLETLNLRVSAHKLTKDQPSHEFENLLWKAHVFDMIERAKYQLPFLQKLCILITDINFTMEQDASLTTTLTDDIMERCRKVGIWFDVYAVELMTPVPYFQAQNEVRNPGRDF